MSATATRPKRRKFEEDAIGPKRPASSMAMVAERVQALRRAWVEADEPLIRGELRALSAEAERLAGQETVLPSAMAARIQIAATARPTGPR
jgi:hypothetical protein